MANIEEAIRRLKFLYEQHGAEQVAAAQEAITASTTETERAALSLEKRFNSLERTHVPAVRAMQNYEKVQKDVAAALAQNPALQQRANVVLENAAQQYKAASQGMTVYNRVVNQGTGEARLARHELINLSRQIQDVGVGLASGQSPFTILVQQGTQIADVFATSSGTIGGFFRQAGAGAARFIGSAAGIAASVATFGGAIVGAAASYASGQREIEKSLMGIGRASGVTREQINQIADASSSAFGISTSEAREAASAFAATGRIYQDNVGTATQIVDAYARAGGNAADVTKTLAEALLDPAKGALELNKSLDFLDATTLNYIRTLQSQGNLQQAQAVLMEAMGPKLRQQAEQTGLLAKAWNFAANEVSYFWNAFGKGAARGIETVTGIEAGGYSLGEKYAAAREKLDRSRETSKMQAFGGEQQLNEILANEAAVRKLEKAMIDLGLSVEQSRLRKLGLDAVEAARSIMPVTAEIESLLGKMNTLQNQRMETGGPVTGAEKVGNVRLVELQQQEQATIRVAEATSQIALMYPGMSIESAKQLYAMQQQLTVAQAKVGVAQLDAQQQAMINTLWAQGVPLNEAIARAALQRQITEAQTLTQARETLAQTQAQLPIAEARTAAERLTAQEVARVAQLIDQRVPKELASNIAAAERANQEAKIKVEMENQLKALDDQYALMRAGSPEEEARVKAAQAYAKAIKDGASEMKAQQIASATLRNERERIAQAEEKATEAAKQRTTIIAANTAAAQKENDLINQLIGRARELAYEWQNIAGALVSIDWDKMEVVLSLMGNVKTWTDAQGRRTQFNPEGYTSSAAGSEFIGLNLQQQREFYGSGKYTESSTGPFGTISIKPNKEWWDAQNKVVDAVNGLTGSTDALNATMQNVLSPYYSQDPRTTKLGFRAGVKGNPDWMVPGASNTNPVGAVTGWPGPQVGYASGGSFTVPGGYSSTDNKLVSFAARSGETVSIGTPESKAVTIDNRIIIQGNVDPSTIDKLKRTQYQQAQRMRGMMSAA